MNQIEHELQNAYHAHQNGQFDHAERLYRKVIQKQPSHFECNSLLGALLVQQQQYSQAIHYLNQTLKLNPKHVNALHNLALAYEFSNQLDQAIKIYHQLLNVDPKHYAALCNLGDAFRTKGDLNAALNYYLKAEKNRPDEPQLQYVLGQTYRLMQHGRKAIQHLLHAIKLKPNFFPAVASLAELYEKTGQAEQALHTYEQALALNPQHPDVASNYCNLLRLNKRVKEAIEIGKLALAANPTHFALKLNLAAAYLANAQTQQAEPLFLECLQEKPDDVETLNNLGAVCYYELRNDEALTYYNRVLEQTPDNAHARWNRSLINLAAGRIKEGWDDYVSGTQIGERYIAPLAHPLWNGETLKNKTLLTYGEQGLGDDILFASCIPDLINSGAHVLLQCDPRLESLYQRSFPGIELIPCKREQLPELLKDYAFDYHIPIGGLARFFRPSAEDFPQKNAFLLADIPRIHFWRQRLAALGDEIKVGIAWRSGLITALRKRSYTDLESMSPIFSINNVRFVSLQYDKCDEEITTAQNQFGYKLHQFDDIDLYNDLDDSAALISALDVVIAPAIATYIIAGAIGTKTLMTTQGGHFSLGSEGTIPWFPNVETALRAENDTHVRIKSIAKRLEEITQAKLTPHPIDPTQKRVVNLY